MTSKEKAAEILALAGITLNGPGPYDMQVKDERLYDRVFSSGSVGIGEGYMEGWWEVGDLPGFIDKVLRARLDERVAYLGMAWYVLRALVVNSQNKNRALEVGERHYDIGNDLYRAMLDKRMVYTCGYWSSPTGPAQSLDEAQEAKLDLVCRKIGLQAGDRVLDIGCGWGSFAKFAAEKYGVKVVGITISKEQAQLARELCQGLDVEIRVEDYRDTQGEFDHIVSLGMFEHVGPKNYRPYMEKAHALLKDRGTFLLHTIGGDRRGKTADPWMDKYIFPNGVLPSAGQVGVAIDNLFVVEDWHNFGLDYEKTLLSWYKNFTQAWPNLKEKYPKEFYRMWEFYLLSSAGSFRSQRLGLWQVVLSKNGVPGGYQSVR